jgi:catechol 2,3-dioxygenase-like lactoylglutathione lyase family enzyme
MGKVTGIHHLCVNTPDIEKSLWFYRELFGFELLGQETCVFGEYAMLRLGSSNLELIQSNNPGEDSFGNRGALAHFGLQVEGIDEVFDSLKQKGVRFLSEDIGDYAEPMGGLRAASLMGPSGEMINLYEFKRAF